MYSLDKFVYKSSVVNDTGSLQNHWTEFVGQFGVNGYRIVSVSLQMLQLMYDMPKFQNKPRLTWLTSPYLPKQPETVIDIAHKTPSGWREHYREHGLHRYDAMLAKALTSRGPFTRGEALKEYGSPEAERVAEEAKEFGIQNSLGMTLWLGQETLVGISLYFPFADIHLDDTTKMMLQTASYVFCSRYHELIATPGIIENQPPKLTPRELDVLQWIALGKTKHEIAEHLQVSTSCIKRHCENIYLKLDVNNMASAVARAMSYGLIVV